MSSLFAALQTSANALGVFEKAIGTTRNNVVNASTPGYVTQSVNLLSRPFQPGNNLWGGVNAGQTIDSRDKFAEKSVWTQSELLGSASQKADSLAQIETQFDITGTSGISGALNSVTSAFSAWSNNPTDLTARGQVVSAISNVAQAFNTTSASLQNIQSQTQTQISNTVTQVNQTVSQIAALNSQLGVNGTADAGVQAQVYSKLQDLSSLVPITVQQESNGSMTILMNGQVQLLTGTTQTSLNVSYPQSINPTVPGGSAPAVIQTAGDNRNVTYQVGGGQLGGLLAVRNTTLPALLGDQSQPGSINVLAKTFADRVNNILKSGVIAAGPPPVPGKEVLTYDTSLLGAVAGTLHVVGNFQGSDLAAIQTTPSTVSNGIANQLTNLQNSQNPADQINGSSISEYYARVATDVGNEASSANNLKSSQTDLLDQAQTLRSQVSGVDLNAQAAKLLEFQKAYEASSKIISVVNQMTSDLMDLIH